MLQYQYTKTNRMDNAVLQVLTHDLMHTSQQLHNWQDQHMVQSQLTTILHIQMKGDQAYMVFKR